MHILSKGLLLGLSMLLLMLGSACANEKVAENHNATVTSSSSKSSSDQAAVSTGEMPKLLVEVNGRIFKATLYDNETSRTLIRRLPLDVSMTELNEREKYYHFTADFPAQNREKPPIIYEGDIMCWSGNTLVLFYKTYENTYDGYVRIGHVDDAGLAAVLGKGDVEVRFSLQEK